MPKPRRASGSGSGRLSGLSLLPDLTIEGGIVSTGASVEEGGREVQPQLALWLEPETGLIRGFNLLVPDEQGQVATGDALATLVAALRDPIAFPGADAGQPGIPSRLVVNDSALAAAARELLVPQGVLVEFDAHPPLIEALAEELMLMLGGDQAGAVEPFSWEIDPDVLPPLFDAAAAFQAVAPWNVVADNPPVGIKLGAHGPEADIGTLYASIIGAAGMAPGVAFYYNLDDFDYVVELGEELTASDEEIDAALGTLRQMGAPIDEMSPDEAREMMATMLEAEAAAEVADPTDMGDSLACLFDPKDQLDESYLEWLRAHGLERVLERETVPTFLRTVDGEMPRLPTEAEARALTLALAALTQFAQAMPGLMQAVGEEIAQLHYPATVRVDDATVAVPMTYPPDEYVENEEDEDEDEDGDIEDDEPD